MAMAASFPKQFLEGWFSDLQGISRAYRSILCYKSDIESFLSWHEQEEQRPRILAFLTPITLIVVCNFLQIAQSIVTSCKFLARNLNCITMPLSLDLIEGTCLSDQHLESIQTAWNWNEWIHHSASYQLIKRIDVLQLTTYNYLVFGITE
jgi:hypothetical protein